MSDRVILERPPPIVSAMEANLYEHVAFVQRRLPGMTVDEREDLLLVDSGLPTDTFNKICRARLAAAEADRRIAEAVAHFRAAGRPFAWWVGPGSRPLDLEARLEAQGLRPLERQVGMARALDALPEKTDSAPELVVRRVSTSAALEDFVRVLAGEPPDAEVGAFFRRAGAVLFEPDCPMRFFVGYLGGEPAAASELFAGGGAAGVHMVATRPQFRRRGLGAALTRAALAEGRRMGLEHAALQASEAGESVYARLGFRAVCQFVEYGTP